MSLTIVEQGEDSQLKLSSPPLIRIAVASDLHAYSGGKDSPSHLNVSEAATGLQHPIAALMKLIEGEHLSADFLLSPGDLGDKADAKGIAYSWSALGQVASGLKCRFYTATAGNHDIDSRLKSSDHNPTHILRGLSPSFPLQDKKLDDQYWSRAYAIKDFSPVRFVILNSASFHGVGKSEKDHGRIDELSLGWLTEDLDQLEPQPINILLCHHHPHQHSELSLGEGDVMKHGQALLDKLGSGLYGRWLVIHGHKHHPKIAYAAGGSASPAVFAAGSLSAILTGPLQTAAKNQFYLLEIDPTACESYGLAARVRAWDFSAGNDWIEASSTGSGLPARFGLGLREDPLLVAARIAAQVSGAPDPLKWSQIESTHPEVQYLLPQDLAEVARVLKARHGLAVSLEGCTVSEVGRLMA